MEGYFYGIVIQAEIGKLDEAQLGGCEVQEAHEAVLRGVFLAVEVLFAAGRGTTERILMGMLQQVVHFLEDHCLQDEERQQGAGRHAVCRAVFQRIGGVVCP